MRMPGRCISVAEVCIAWIASTDKCTEQCPFFLKVLSKHFTLAHVEGHMMKWSSPLHELSAERAP